MREFLRGVIAMTADEVFAYKIQKTVFDVLDAGSALLQELIEYVHPEFDGIPSRDREPR